MLLVSCDSWLIILFIDKKNKYELDTMKTLKYVYYLTEGKLQNFAFVSYFFSIKKLLSSQIEKRGEASIPDL